MHYHSSDQCMIKANLINREAKELDTLLKLDNVSCINVKYRIDSLLQLLNELRQEFKE